MNRANGQQKSSVVADIQELELVTKKVARARITTGEKLAVKERSKGLWRDNKGQLHSGLTGLTTHWIKVQ